MPTETTVRPPARPYTGQGPGSVKPRALPGAASTDRSLSEWLERCTDEKVCWLVVRLIHCKFNWLTPSGEWVKKQKDAAAWTEREDAYTAARQATGLLYCYDRA